MLIENKATALKLASTWEWHSKKIDVDVQPGQNVTLEYGLGQYLHERLEVGFGGYTQWQVTDDSGNSATNKDRHDRVSAVSGQVTFWAVKEKCAIVAKYVKEYNANDRLEGEFGQINVTWIF